MLFGLTVFSVTYMLSVFNRSPFLHCFVILAFGMSLGLIDSSYKEAVGPVVAYQLLEHFQSVSRYPMRTFISSCLFCYLISECFHSINRYSMSSRRRWYGGFSNDNDVVLCSGIFRSAGDMVISENSKSHDTPCPSTSKQSGRCLHIWY